MNGYQETIRQVGQNEPSPNFLQQGLNIAPGVDDKTNHGRLDIDSEGKMPDMHDDMNTKPNKQSSAKAPVLALLNPKSGTCRIEDVRRELLDQFRDVPLQFHELTAGEDLAPIVDQAIKRGCVQVVAAGGDGTISAIAGLLVGKKVRLAVLPLGTANVLALELNIPIDLTKACHLAASPCLKDELGEKTSTVRSIDMMKVANRHYLTQVGVGIDALMIRTTSAEAKRRLGKLAYLASAAKHILAFRSHRFQITIDSQTQKLRAAQIVIANTGMMGQPSFRWGPDIEPDDGRLNACIINSSNLKDFARLFWVVFRGHREKTPNMKHKTISQSITIESRHPLPVQADGELIGETPVTVEVVPKTIEIIVPITQTG